MLHEKLAATPRARRALADLTRRSLNYDPDEVAAARPGSGASGWR
jgi:hypothetical protein